MDNNGDEKNINIAESGDEDNGQIVTPWEVSAKDGGKIDYDKLIDKFGCQRLDLSLIQRIERITARPAHVFLRRNVFFAHRSFLSLFLLVIFGITDRLSHPLFVCFLNYQ